MKAGYWVKLALGLALIALLCLAAYKLLDGILDFVSKISDGGGEIVSTDEYRPETPEPLPTMPEYMEDDSFYDNASNMDYHE